MENIFKLAGLLIVFWVKLGHSVNRTVQWFSINSSLYDESKNCRQSIIDVIFFVNWNHVFAIAISETKTIPQFSMIHSAIRLQSKQ